MMERAVLPDRRGRFSTSLSGAEQRYAEDRYDDEELFEVDSVQLLDQFLLDNCWLICKHYSIPQICRANR